MWGGELKELVLERGKRGGCVYLRPDSGDPKEVVLKVRRGWGEDGSSKKGIVGREDGNLRWRGKIEGRRKGGWEVGFGDRNLARVTNIILLFTAFMFVTYRRNKINNITLCRLSHVLCLYFYFPSFRPLSFPTVSHSSSFSPSFFLPLCLSHYFLHVFHSSPSFLFSSPTVNHLPSSYPHLTICFPPSLFSLPLLLSSLLWFNFL